jgi:flagellar biosynthetic protein FliR
MLDVVNLLLPMITALWWPFCRSMALLSTAPVVGEGLVPLPVRALLSVVLAFLMLPMTKGGHMPDPFSLAGVIAMVEQAVIGGVIGFALQLTMAAVAMLGFLASSQVGFSMAQMNDPVNGQQSDVISTLLSLAAILVFFAIDGHLVLAGVLAQSFLAWPVGGGYSVQLLQTVTLNVGWVFSAAILLALPIIFSTLVVQFGFGFLNRVAPSLNLFSLGFSLVTIFGLMMLVQVVRFVPEHYVQMTNQVLEMLQQQMKLAANTGAAHG